MSLVATTRSSVAEPSPIGADPAPRLLSDAAASPTARQIIDAGGVVTHFQPIFSAKQKSVIGVEALSRGIAPETKTLIPPNALFQMAAAEKITGELERLCRHTALKTFAGLRDEDESLILFLNFDASALDAGPASEGGLLFVNFDPSVQDLGAEVADGFLERVKALGLDPGRIAVEILESKFDNVKKLEEVLDALRACGFLLAIDDVGAGHSNLDRIPLIRPDIIKVDRSLIQNIDGDYHKQEAFKSLAQLARRTGALVVAEGVETKMEALTALELGADLLQGFYLSRPRPADALEPRLAGDAVQALAREYKSYMVSKINQRKLQHRRYNIIINTILCELSKVTVEQFGTELLKSIVPYPAVECVYVLDEAGIQVSDTICNPASPIGRRGSKGLMFRPALKGADHSLKEFYYVLLDVELQKYTTDPYVSLASGNVCRTISTCFRDAGNSKMYILCIDVVSE